MKPLNLSLIVIAKNEAKDIGNCIKSVQELASEIIVLDSGSTDGTQEIARALGAVVYETDWPGDGIQKNRAISKATQPWILCLDADESLSKELHQEIRYTIQKDDGCFSAYSMPRSSSFCGQFMRHSGWWPDRIVRLFKQNSAHFTEPRTHATLIVQGPVGKLSFPIIHRAIIELSESVEKMNLYSTEGARALYDRRVSSSFSKAIFKGLWTFFRVYFLRLGFLDGRRGFMLAIVNAEGTYYKYAKLWLLSAKSNQHG